ncbi:hypothetical protein TspCOW1_01520 [Thiohalobacter sp. COW1]|uniref:hypothetical protein n=1 Tax=Thiohalobacter sp. COW1 TaxID=2795687 RepID=UPI001915CC0A|nr:hypothetical protein [Thiohalobacter sp. COW1]BCO30049.1 hypothetical protein TspCOW1_01520 [Thiohalobacter sp. COW1]
MRTKLNLVAASVAMAVSGGAQAGALGAANEIFIGGATAPQNFLREDLTIRVCDPSDPIQVFVDEVESLPSETPGGGILNQGDHVVVRCTVKGSFPAPMGGADLAVYKYNGGSSTGVAPVAVPDGASPGNKIYLDASVAGCDAVTNSQGDNAWPIGLTGNSYELYECTDPSLIKNQDPDAGISDIEPAPFVGPLALSAGTEPLGVPQRPTQEFEDKGNLDIKPGPGLLFGTAVTLPMYDDLVESQANAGMLPADCAVTQGSTRAERDAVRCMPSLPSAFIKSVFLGQVTSWADAAPYGLSLNPTSFNGGVNQGNNVHLCKRTNGSGTHAQFSINFLGTNCRANSNLSMVEQNDGVSFAGIGLVGMYANSGSSDMDDCLNALGTGNGFDGDFAGLPQTDAANFGTGDSSVVPGKDLDPTAGVVQTASGAHPLGITYDNGGVPFTAYGMGYNSLEKNTKLNLAYRFVKVDGVAPTLENAISGEYKDVYYLSYQNRVVNGEPDLRTGGIRTTPADATEKAVAKEYFKVWNAVAASAIKAVNETLVVDPNGTKGDADDWQGGYVTPVAGASAAYDGSNPETPWARQTLTGAPDSCQDLGAVR